MNKINNDIFKSKKVIGNIFPVHEDVVIGLHEHFQDGRKFISVSEDSSIAIIDSETLEVEKNDNIANSKLTASAMVSQNSEKLLLVGTRSGELLLINKDIKINPILLERRQEITSICDLEDGTIVIAHGDDENGSTIQYISLVENRIINEIKFLPGRKIKQMHKITGVKDKCIVSCSMSNIYWFKVVDKELKLLIDQPSPDDYFYDQVWSDGKNIIKAGQSCFTREDCPAAIKDIISKEAYETRGKSSSLFVDDRIVIRGEMEQFRISDREGVGITAMKLPKGRFPMQIQMHRFGRITMGFQTGEVGRFEYLSQSLRFIMD